MTDIIDDRYHSHAHKHGEMEEARHSKTIAETIAEFANFSTILRMSGALIIIAAMSAFLLQGWKGGNDIERFYMLLAQTILLATGGFGLSYLLRENKGARVFFGLSLLSTTANMVTLGALIFSLVQWGANLGSYPAFASWKAAAPVDLLTALSIGIIVLAPIISFAFMIFGRNSSKQLATIFAFTNLLLLIPVRESWMLGIIVAIGLIVPAWYALQALKEDITLRTPEGYFALATAFVPAVIILIRSLFFYEVDALLQLMLSATAFFLLRVASDQPENNTGVLQRFGSVASVVFAIMIAHPLADILTDTNQGFYTLFGISFMTLVLDVASRFPVYKKRYARLSSVVLAISCLIPFLSEGNALSAIVFIMAGSAVLGTAKYVSDRFLITIGIAMILAGLLHQLYKITIWIDFSNWMTLAIFGTCTIITASVIERHGVVMKHKLQKLISMKL